MQNLAQKELSRAKMLGGIGSILTLLLFVPDYVGAVLVIIGWVLILIAVKDISEAVQDRTIFTNAIISAVMTIIGAITFAVVATASVLSFISSGGQVPMNGTTTPPPGFVGLILGLILGIAVLWIFWSVGSFFLWRSFKGISAKMPVGLFGTGALLFFIGSILTIILIGFVLIFIAQILFVVAFFSIPDRPTTQPAMMQPGTAPPS